MDITPAIPADRQVIDSYGPGRFKVAGQDHAGSIIVFPDRTIEWAATDWQSLKVSDFEPIIKRADAVEVLLLGLGERMQLLPSALRAEIKTAGIAMDAMDTGAACRTYNILLSEGRRVAAALIAQ